MSELTTRSSHEQEWRQAQAQKQAERHNPHHPSSADISPYSPELLGSRQLSKRSNGPLRATLALAMQQTHGNRAVQRALPSHTTSSRALLLPVQRDDFTSTGEVEDFMSVADDGVCYPEEEEMSAAEESG